MRSYLVLGDWNAICDRCGFKYKGSQLRLEWTGLRVCDACFETRHPMDLMQVREAESEIPWSRPEPDDIFRTTGDAILAENGDYLRAETMALLLTET